MPANHDVRNLNLWVGMTPKERWTTYRAFMDAKVDVTFNPERKNAIAQIRPSVSPVEPSAVAGR